MKRKLLAVLLTVVLTLGLMACGDQNTTEVYPTESEKSEVLETDISNENTKEIVEDDSLETESAEETDEVEYEDNFAVDSEAAANFARKIKEVVANQDIEGLANLIAYPVYVGFEDEGISVNSKEEMLALDAEKIFTSEMMASIENADETTLSPSKAGFALYAENGPNIIFGVVDGKLAIRGINY